jgi:RNA polymerase sigma-70 factor (ECF subfamily)
MSEHDAHDGCGHLGQEREESADLLAISRVLQGDPDAFRPIVERYRGLIFRLAMCSLGNREDAEEAAQEIFLRVFRSLRGFRMERRFVPWLYAIAANYLRTRAVRVRAIDGALVRDLEHRIPDRAEDDPQSHVVRTLSAAEIRHAVATLPVPLRDAVTLYYLEGMSIQRAASTLGVGMENVKSRLMRARGKLKTLLGADATKPPRAGYNRSENG